MVSSIYKKTFSVLMKRPFRLWGISLLAEFLCLVAYAGFIGVPAAAFDESAELGCEDTLMVSSVSSIRTLTVGSGFPPDQPLARVAGCRGRRYESRLRRSPPVRNCTFPETCLTMYTPGCG